MRAATMSTQYFQRLLADEGVQIIVPPRRIKFLKFEGGEAAGGHVSPDFDTFYYCWKMFLPQDILYLSRADNEGDLAAEELFGGEEGVAALMRGCGVDDGDESDDGAPQSAHSSQLSSH